MAAATRTRTVAIRVAHPARSFVMRDFPAQEGLCGLDERTSCRYVQGDITAQLFRLEKRQACNVDLEGLELLPKRFR